MNVWPFYLTSLSRKNSDLWTWFSGTQPYWYEARTVSQGEIQVNHCESHDLPVLPDRVRLGRLCSADDSQVEWCTKKPLRPEQPGYHRLHALPFDKAEPPIHSVLDLALLSHSLYSAQQDRALPA
jgi:hypothetical protein